MNDSRGLSGYAALTRPTVAVYVDNPDAASKRYARYVLFWA